MRITLLFISSLLIGSICFAKETYTYHIRGQIYFDNRVTGSAVNNTINIDNLTKIESKRSYYTYDSIVFATATARYDIFFDLVFKDKSERDKMLEYIDKTICVNPDTKYIGVETWNHLEIDGIGAPDKIIGGVYFTTQEK